MGYLPDEVNGEKLLPFYIEAPILNNQDEWIKFQYILQVVNRVTRVDCSDTRVMHKAERLGADIKISWGILRVHSKDTRSEIYRIKNEVKPLVPRARIYVHESFFPKTSSPRPVELEVEHENVGR